MRLFIKVLRGESAADAEPILVTDSADVVAAVGRAVAQELGVELSPRIGRRPPDALAAE